MFKNINTQIQILRQFKMPFLISLAVVFIAGCSSQAGVPQERATKDGLHNNSDSQPTLVLQKNKLQYQLILPGELKPYESVSVYAKIVGFVKKWYVDRGSQVHKGQVLAALDAPEINQQYMAALARKKEVNEKLLNSLQQYQRVYRASQVAGAVSPSSLEQAYSRLLADSAALNAASASVHSAKAMRDYTIIRSPFDGIIAQRNISDGAMVGKDGQPLFVLFQSDRLRLEVSIPAEHAQNIDTKNTSFFSIGSRPGESFPAKFARSSQALDLESRTLTLEFDINNSQQLMNAGSIVEVTVQLKRPFATILIPQTAILQEKNGQFLIKRVNGNLRKATITTGITWKDSVEVFGNIAAGDTILRHGNRVGRISES